MIVGMDFGTTNSGMAVFDGADLRVLPLDPENSNPRVLRTALYITNQQNVIIGQAAMHRYFAHNLNRPVKMERLWIGEIEIRGADMYYVTDAYVLTDVYSPGRLFLSIKSNLRDIDYAGTVIGPFHYALEDLIAAYLHVAKLRAERLLQRDLDRIVLGRPVHFAYSAADDRLAQARLLTAALRAGYETVYFQREPVAAAYAYAREVGNPQNVLVFDFGGGTLDLTVMRVNDGAQAGRRHRVLASGGIPVAGDVFDQKLIRAKLPQHFGDGSTFGPPHKRLTVPKWIFDSLADWQKILELQTPENKAMLQEIAATSTRPRDVKALLSLVSSNYGVQMFETVEGAKRQLSARVGTMIKLEGDGFQVRQLVTRGEFEAIINAEVKAIDAHVDETVAASGLRPDQIDAVIRTGGSAQIPIFIQMLEQKFGAERVLAIDTFSSVTGGLGITAHEVDQGESALEPFTVADLPTSHVDHAAAELARDEVAAEANQVQVRPINLELLKRRLRAAEAEAAGLSPTRETGLVLVTGDNQVFVQRVQPATGAAIQLEGMPELDRPVQTLLLADLDEPLLLITSNYRFLSITARQLIDLRALGLGVSDLHPLAAREVVCAVARWTPLRDRPRLVLVTMLGFARKYLTPTLRDRIEGPVPFSFDQPLEGWPYGLVGGDTRSSVTLVSASSRGVRLSMKALPTRGAQLLQKERDDLLIAAVTAPEDGELLLLTGDGWGRRLGTGAVYEATRPKDKGRLLLSRRDVVAAVALDETRTPYILTNRGALVPLDVADVERVDDSTRAERIVRLDSGESIVGALVA